MGSSAKPGKNFFEGHWNTFLHKNAIWDRTLPHLHIKCSLHVCRRVQGSQIFKRNSIILIRSKVMAFLVILFSTWSPSSTHHPHIIAIAPRRSPCGPISLWSLWSPSSPPHVVPMVPTSSPWSPCHPCRPCHPHAIPTSSRRPHIIPNPPNTHFTYRHPPEGWEAPNQ